MEYIVRKVNWDELSKDDFAANIARCFSKLWQIHPFREGNTRTIVMLITLFTESHGYYFDQELMSSSAGYVRNAFVFASLGEYSEYEHLEKILKDAISVEPIQNNSISDSFGNELNDERYQKYATKDYKPAKHEYIE